MARLIDLDNLTLDYGGLRYISPMDFIGICKYFTEQLDKMPIVDAVPREEYEAMKADRDSWKEAYAEYNERMAQT